MMIGKMAKTKYLPTFKYECEARINGALMIAGIDEVGRGPLAGPVVAACVILPEDFPEIGVDDSKRLLPKKRESLANEIEQRAICWAIGKVEPEEIDRINIYQASRLAMKRATQSMTITPGFLLIDGRANIDIHIAQRTIIKGDQQSLSIASAAILAKVARDKMMETFHDIYPEYGFNKHKGYATKNHLEAIRKNGPSPIHRKSFKPIRETLQLKLFV